MPPKKQHTKATAANVSSSLDLESEDISLETTVPTTEDVSSSDEQRDGSQKVTRQLIERKELLHHVQLLKIELSQKNLIIDNMKADHMSKVEELEERLNDALHQKQVFSLRLDSQLKLAQEENRKQQALRKQEMEAILLRQQQLEETNRQLCERAGELRRSLRDLDISKDRYQELRDLPEDKISIQEYVAMRFYEVVTPLRAHLAELSVKRGTMTEELDTHRTQMKALMESYEEERRLRTELELRSQRLTLELADTKQLIQEGDYRRDNYPSVKRDRYKSEYETKLKEELENIRLKTSQEIDNLQRTSREMYERENSCWPFHTHSLSLALSPLLRSHSLSASHRKPATTDASHKPLTPNPTHAPIFGAKNEAAELEMASDNCSIEGQFESQLSVAECRDLQAGYGQAALLRRPSAAQMLKQETAKALAQCQVECEKQQKKLELLTQEFYRLQTSSEKRSAELQAQNAEQASRLETYEKLEQELDQVTMQAAEIENEEEAERVLFSYGYGANVPTTAKRRLKQSVHLARRVLQLERLNTSLTRELGETQVTHGTDI
ncbi:Progesterone-induced-blocking factor 1 [Larimichthys crocea]|uniref:Uncharacterized protein n=1 Tax=Larimichthys crocea TaxID=215358 RepID=A0ACD3QDI8_LARCR|nr:Progesterone-induced-blocking factor 1 [Larimichthys crocea]